MDIYGSSLDVCMGYGDAEGMKVSKMKRRGNEGKATHDVTDACKPPLGLLRYIASGTLSARRVLQNGIENAAGERLGKKCVCGHETWRGGAGLGTYSIREVCTRRYTSERP